MSGSTANGIMEQLTCDSTMEDSRIPHSMQKSRSDNHWRALRGELYYAFTPEMDPRPLPAELASQDIDDAQFEDDPWVEAPIHIDYGTNLELGAGVFINFNCTVIDTCHVSIGARTLVDQTKDVPHLVVAAGNPAHILRRINRLSESPEIVDVDGELEQDREPIPRASLEDETPPT
ncbi:hypothetical protein B0A49_10784 [Cryomyces minteri]|uniref:Maltose/galactoside acetyltransferase domain-containing protein n=1 Tax=Cryomyces minteri TaxID=331657 RepID=A0A4U0VN77_9PEZI|nr:hypothetical protein B0A49_10784 [Cryomyces minteri]